MTLPSHASKAKIEAQAAFHPSAIINFYIHRLLLRRFRFPRQTGLLLGLTDEAHGSVETGIVAEVGVAGYTHADFSAFVVEVDVFVVAHVAFHLKLRLKIVYRGVISRRAVISAKKSPCVMPLKSTAFAPSNQASFITLHFSRTLLNISFWP